MQIHFDLKYVLIALYLAEVLFVHFRGRMRIILFCDVDRPLHTTPMRGFNRWFGLMLGRATAVRNEAGEPLGFVNRIFFLAHHAGEIRKRVKRFNKPRYHSLKFVLACGTAYVLLRW